MSATKKRRRSPEPEDLAAAVADIINSPITRTTLNFLRPLVPTAPEPMGVDAKPIGIEQTPMGLAPLPVGFEPEPIGVEQLHVDITPAGVESQPMGGGRKLWQAEGLGSIFEDSRVRRIQKAQDALSLVEEKVYDLLWGTKNQRR